MELRLRLYQNAQVNVSILRNWSDLEHLETEWSELLRRSAANSIFLTWEWVRTWIELTAGQFRPFVVIVRGSDGVVAGIAPLYLTEFRLLKIIPLRALRFVGDTASGAEYPDWIVDRNHETEVVRLIAQAIRENQAEWDLIWMPRLASWSGARARVTGSLRETGLACRERTTQFCAFDLPTTFAEYEAGFSAKRRQQMRRITRKTLKKDGVEIVPCNESTELASMLEALFKLHQDRWSSIGENGVFVRKPVLAREFYQRFAPLAFERGWLVIFGLRQNGVWRAIQYGYRYAGEYLQLQEGYDPDFDSGAGNALRHSMIEQLIEMGLTRYDFLGGWTEHKRRWGGTVRDGADLIAYSDSIRTKIPLVRNIWPTGRFIEE